MYILMNPSEAPSFPRADRRNAHTEAVPKNRRPGGRQRIRRGVIALGLSGILIGASAGAAAASSQDATLNPGDGKTFKTWFWGRTPICYTNLGSEYASYEWISSTSFGSGSLAPGDQRCTARSYVGFEIYVQNTSASSSPVHVSFPHGP
jgi:hypothetical protein